MNETRELGKALLALRREQYAGAATLTKALDPTPIDDSTADGLLTGYASKFWVIDSYGECTSPGCFAQSIKERGPAGANRIPFRYEHQWTIGNHTKMEEDGVGLKIEAKIVDDGQWGTVLRRQLAEAVPYGLSIGYRYITGRMATPDDPLIWDFAPRWMQEDRDFRDVYVLQNLNLKEDSGVTFPAVDPAMIDSYRAESTATLERALAGLKSGTLTPSQIGLIRELAAALPADVAPAGGQVPPRPGTKSDSSPDDDLAFLALTVSQFERLVA